MSKKKKQTKVAPAKAALTVAKKEKALKVAKKLEPANGRELSPQENDTLLTVNNLIVIVQRTGITGVEAQAVSKGLSLLMDLKSQIEAGGEPHGKIAANG